MIVFAVAILAVVGGIVYMSVHKSQRVAMQNATIAPTTTVMQPMPTGQTLPPGTSDDQLSKDSQSIDDSMNALDSDLQNADQGLSDQQTNLQ